MSPLGHTLETVEQILQPDLSERRISTGERLLRVVMAEHHALQEAVGEKKTKKPGPYMPALKLLAIGPAVFMVSKMMIEAFTDLGKAEVPIDTSGIDWDKFIPSGSESLKKMFVAPELEQPEAFPQEEPAPVSMKTIRGLPAPTNEVAAAIRSASRQTGTDYHTLYALAGTESGFNTTVKASTSSATGLMQFTTPTWRYLTQEIFPELKYTMEDRKNPEKSAILASLYLDMIRKSLLKGTGKQPTIGDLYLGYFMGPGGAVKFLTAKAKNPDAISAELFPKAAAANPSLFFDKLTGRALTLQETYDKLTGRITKYYLASKQSEQMLAQADVKMVPALAAGAQQRTNSAVATAQANAISEAKQNKGRDRPIVVQDQVAMNTGQRQQTMVTPSPQKPRVDVTYTRDKHDRIVAIPS